MFRSSIAVRNSALRVIALLILPGLAGAASFTPLGDGNAYDVSADGSVVVGSSAGTEAWRWTGGVTTPLDEDPSHYIQARIATGVSADGAVVVGYGSNNSRQEVFRWTGGNITTLGVLPGDAASPNAFSYTGGVSADGAVVVGTSSSGYGSQGFRWTGGVMTGLGFLPGGTSSTAYGVSADGEVVVGFSSPESGNSQAFRWTGGAMTGLGQLPGGLYSVAYDASADGSVVVGAGHNASGQQEAFRWVGGAMTALGDLPGGIFQSEALRVSDDGSVVLGRGASPGDISEAFIWTEANGLQKLFDLLVANGATGVTGWTQFYGLGMSGDGQWVVGSGINPLGQQEAFLANIAPAVVPVPPAIWLFGSAVGLMGVMRRKISS